ncbi:uncharacterized protein LOC133520980 [Cydia pomonella]|uniref:uncharacterized protein LOC133520980 n=1 Tax=Cydia pomonella TaxID=82600 RepID=UPI002ADDAD87|nr:uncharacterized protein LOC133520980 [Cydia pomonella]
MSAVHTRREPLAESLGIAPISDPIGVARDETKSETSGLGMVAFFSFSACLGVSRRVCTARNTSTNKGSGRPKSTWWSNIRNDLKNLNIEEQTTQNRPLWRKLTRRPDPT